MDVDEPMEEAVARFNPLTQPPKDDFGSVRERRDFSIATDVSLRPLLPSPYRDLTFSSLAGWQYHPPSLVADRLGNQTAGNINTEMTIPDSWNDRARLDRSDAWASSKRQLEMLESLEQHSRKKFGENTLNTPIYRMEENPKNDFPRLSEPLPPVIPFENLSSVFTTKGSPQFSDEATASTSMSTYASSSVSGRDTSTFMSPERLAEEESFADLDDSGAIPKQALYFMYGKKPFKVQLKPNNYVTWDNGKPAQDIQYASAFVCPITKEIFLGASYLRTPCVKDNGMYWYAKKKLAEHSAAARAFDCWNMRDGAHGRKRLSLETPYFEEDAPILPMTKFPLHIQEIFTRIQHEHRNASTKARKKETPSTRGDVQCCKHSRGITPRKHNNDRMGYHDQRRVHYRHGRSTRNDDTEIHSGRPFGTQFSTHDISEFTYEYGRLMNSVQGNNQRNQRYPSEKQSARGRQTDHR